MIWDTGTPWREFLYADDMAEACFHVMSLKKTVYEKHTSLLHLHINVGAGTEITIRNLAELTKEVVGFEGDLVFDSTKLDGTPRKLLDVQIMNALGWPP